MDIYSIIIGFVVTVVIGFPFVIELIPLFVSIIKFIIVYIKIGMEKITNKEVIECLEKDVEYLEETVNYLNTENKILSSKIKKIEEKQNYKQKHISFITKLILKKTQNSLKLPTSYNKCKHIDYNSGIKYMIEFKKDNTVSNIDIGIHKKLGKYYYKFTTWLYNKNHTSTIPVFNESTGTNIFNIKDNDYIYVPRMFYEVLDENGNIDIKEMKITN